MKMTKMTAEPFAPLAFGVDQTLRKVATQRSVGTRVKVLQDGDVPMLKKAMYYAYNPYIKFGIKIGRTEKYDLITSCQMTSGLDLDEPDIWAMLDDFSTSTASSVAKLSTLTKLFCRLNVTTGTIVAGILEKSLVTGVSASTVNKAWPKTIPVFNIQLAQKYTDRKIKSFPQYVEIKYDGVRAAGLVYPSGEVEVKTRTGRSIPAAKYFHDELRSIGKAYKTVINDPAGLVYEGIVTDGELCGDTFNDAVSIFRSDAPATSGTYVIFDLLPMTALTDDAFVSDAYATRRVTLDLVMTEAARERAGAAVPLTKVFKSNSYLVNSRQEIWNMYYEARKSKLEGVIVKSPNGLWERKRSNAWLKIKAEETLDLPIVGAFEGEGEKIGTLGGLIVDFKGVLVRVGSGYTAAVSDELWAMFQRDLARHSAGDDDHFELINRLAEVQFQEVTPDGSLRHPVFVRLRADKDEVSF